MNPSLIRLWNYGFSIPRRLPSARSFPRRACRSKVPRAARRLRIGVVAQKCAWMRQYASILKCFLELPQRIIGNFDIRPAQRSQYFITTGLVGKELDIHIRPDNFGIFELVENLLRNIRNI